MALAIENVLKPQLAPGGKYDGKFKAIVRLVRMSERVIYGDLFIPLFSKSSLGMDLLHSRTKVR